jgi:glycine cleavage system H lipoate-binding protein
MFPWSYGFHWSAGALIFLGAFYGVLTIVAGAVCAAMARARRDVRTRRTGRIRWRANFEELPARDRVCRHVLTGEFRSRWCLHAFDCRECGTHAKLVAARPKDESHESAVELFGLCFPLDRFYHRGHTWARPEADGTMTVGIDDLGRRLLAAADAVDLPEPGTRVQASETAFCMRSGGTWTRIPCPIDGEVLERGGPGDGWLLRVRPEPRNDAHLLRGAEVRPWLLREMERLHVLLTADGAALTLPDGGLLVDDLQASCPAADWETIRGEMFLDG